MQSVNLNMIPGAVMPVVNVSQYDVGRQFKLNVFEGAASYSLTGKDVQIRGTKPDGNGFAYDSTDGAISVSGNVVTVTTLQQMTAVGGQTMVELRITSGSTVLGTLNFVLDVEHSALSDDTPISDTDIPAIERDFQAALDEAEADALIAEGYAKGTQDGVPATSGEPYYQDNAKYYKEQAEAAASGEGTNALKAEGYAVGTQNGTPVSSGSPYYQNNAKYYEGEAATSASNASTSETNAGNSASAAAADALEAEGFAVGEQNGVPVSSGSPYYQNNAKYYNQTANPTVLANMSDVDIDNPQNHQVLEYNSTSQKWENAAGGNVSDLSDLDDVTISTPTDGQALIYDSNSGDWVNGTVSTVGSIDDLSDVDITSASNGDLLQYNSTSQEWENSADVPDEIAAISNVMGAKNVLPFDAVSQVINGITWTIARDSNGHLLYVDADGSTPANSSSFVDVDESKLLNTLEFDTPYILTACPSGGSHTTYDALLRGKINGASSWIAQEDGNSGGTVFTLSSQNTYEISTFRLTIYKGTTVNHIKFYPMIRPAAITDPTYVPYVMTNRELTERVTADDIGTYVDITSYTDGSPYTCPSDGYVVLGVSSTSGKITGRVKSTNNNNSVLFAADESVNRNTLFVKKGMRISVKESSGTVFAEFNPLS